METETRAGDDKEEIERELQLSLPFPTLGTMSEATNGHDLLHFGPSDWSLYKESTVKWLAGSAQTRQQQQ